MAENEDILSKGEAAEYIGVSVRQLIRLTGKGEVKHLPKRRESEPTRYSRAALDAYLGKLPSIVSGDVTSGTLNTHDTPGNNGNSQALARRPAESVTLVTHGAADTPEFWLRLASAFDAMSTPVRVVDKLTLSVAEAAQLSGFTKDALRDAIGAGKLKAKIVKGRRGWTIKREDLDSYVKKL
jgi:excisionase family DNA binding protein